VGGPYAVRPSTADGTPCNPKINGQSTGRAVGPAITPYYCSFLFDSPANGGGPTGTVYLDDTNPDNASLYLGPRSVLGGTEHWIGNGVCKIHTSSSSIQQVPSYCQNCAPNNLIVVLDIELLQNNTTWFMYEFVQNEQLFGNHGNQGQWSLWGYWNVTSIQ